MRGVRICLVGLILGGMVVGSGVPIEAASTLLHPIQWIRDHMSSTASKNATMAQGVADVPTQSRHSTRDLETRLSRYIDMINPRLSDNKRDEMVTHIIEQSHRHSMDPTLIAAIISVESQFNPMASHRGALGLGQLMGETARRLGVNDPFSISENINGTVRYTAQHYKKWAKSPFQTDFTLASYIMGGVKSTHPTQLSGRIQQYIQRVKAQQKQINEL